MVFCLLITKLIYLWITGILVEKEVVVVVDVVVVVVVDDANNDDHKVEEDGDGSECTKRVFSNTNNVINVASMYGMLDDVYWFLLELHISSSQKHICPLPELSIMHTWSTINKFICSCDVHIRLTTS